MTSRDRKADRTLSAITGAMFLVSLAVGLVLYYMTEMGVGIILWVILIIMGATVAVLAPLQRGRSTNFGPSETDYGLVTGILMLVIGLAGYMYMFTDLDWIAPVALIILAVAALVIILAVKNRDTRSD